MKPEEVRNMTDEDLREKLEENKKKLFELRFQLQTRKLKNHQVLPELKRDIARIQTVLRERELMEQYAGEHYVPVKRETISKSETPRRRGLFGRNR